MNREPQRPLRALSCGSRRLIREVQGIRHEYALVDMLLDPDTGQSIRVRQQACRSWAFPDRAATLVARPFSGGKAAIVAGEQRELEVRS